MFLGLLSIVVLVDFAESEGLFRHIPFLVDILLNLREMRLSTGGKSKFLGEGDLKRENPTR